MTWSLSEYLNQFEFRSQSWCFIEIGSGYAVRVPSADVVYFYVLMEQELTVYSAGTPEIKLTGGDVLLVLSGKSHMLSYSPHPRRRTIPLLQTGGYVDTPPTLTVGSPPHGTRVLCGRLKVRWPTGKRLKGLPDMLAPASASLNLDIRQFVAAAEGHGGSAMLTHLANLIFITTFRKDPACMNLFAHNNELDPVDRACRYMELHPTHAWSVEILARKVGMSRSSFAAKFVAKLGKTPMDMLLEERMKLAASLLEGSDLKIAEIAERIGYRSEAAFHHRFMAHFAMAPGQFRRKRHPNISVQDI